ncbi:MAG: hypothetical protein ACXVGB_00585 [Mycobacteriaceae bacterium]
MSLRPAGPPVTGQLTVASKLPVTDALGTGGAKVSALIAARAHPVLYFRVKALAGNAAKVFIGDSNVAVGTGDELAAGESIAVDHSDPTLFYVIASNAADKISVTAVLAG